jgi:hypothetical protein
MNSLLLAQATTTGTPVQFPDDHSRKAGQPQIHLTIAQRTAPVKILAPRAQKLRPVQSRISAGVLNAE